MEPLIVKRTARSNWLVISPNQDASYTTSSEQAEWGFAVSAIFRVLASPLSGQAMPRAPRPGDRQEYAGGYWSSLLHMLLYSLGWARPDRGLWWWYQSGKPVDDLRLQLLAEVFDRDGQLEWFAAWLWDHPNWLREKSQLVPSTFRRLTGWSDSDTVPEVERGWIESRCGEASASGIHAPVGGGWDPLHLSSHCAGPIEAPRQASQLLRSSDYRRQAVLVLDSMSGWYAALCEAGKVLPPLGQMSWDVDVIVKPTGWLGTYRRSRVSGLWFSGKHRFHTPGA